MSDSQKEKKDMLSYIRVTINISILLLSYTATYKARPRDLKKKIEFTPSKVVTPLRFNGFGKIGKDKQ